MKKLLLMLLLATSPAWAQSTQILMGGDGVNNLVNSAVRYRAITGISNTYNATEANTQQVIASAGTISELYVQLSAAPGDGKSYQFQASINGDTTGAPSVTITGAATTTGNSGATSLAVTAGQKLCLKITPSGTPTAVKAYWSMKFVSTTTGESLLLGGGSSDATPTSGTNYNLVVGDSAWYGTAGSRTLYSPTDGTLKNFYFDMETAPGADTTVTLTVMVGGLASAITCAISGTDKTCNDTAHTADVAQGTMMSLRFVATTGTPAASVAHWGMTFLADTAGESVIMAATGSISVDTYQNVNTSLYSSTTETNTYTLGGDCVIKKLYAIVTTAPGAGKSWAVTLQSGGSPQALTTTISDAETSDVDNSNTYTATTSTLLDWFWNETGTVSASGGTRASAVCYVAPVAASTRRRVVVIQ